jgi:hypothetical protein
MPKPLHFGDPGELGPFRLEARLHESAAGIVYLGSDPQGRRVEVALLTTAAAAEAPRVSAFPRTPPVGGPDEPAPVVAALHDSGTPWVATAHEEGRPGAERFLRPVLLDRGWGMGRRHRGGPSFQQYWVSGPRGPAVYVPEPPPTPAPALRDSKGLAAAAVSLAALLLLLALLVVLLFSCEPKDPGPPQPTDVPTTVPLVPPPPIEPTPSSSPSPSPSRTGTRTPRPTQTGGQDTVNPAGRAGYPQDLPQLRG